MIVVDTTFLILLFDPAAIAHVDRGADRVRYLIEKATKARETIMIPAPAIAELVVSRVERVEEIVAAIRS
jgi:predicted nucleic acid-binding protein